MKPVFFFNGTDPAPSDQQRSDDGAAVVAAATPRRDLAPGEPLPKSELDWNLDFIYARVFTAAHRMSARQWSGFLYLLDERFGFTQMCMDAGAGGGGIYVKRAMMEPTQLIAGVERKVPVLLCDKTLDSQRQVARGRFILNMFKRGDPGIDSVWPDPTGSKSLSGDDLLKDALLSSFREACHQGVLHWPPEADDYLGAHREDVQGWGTERTWALKNLSGGSKQLTNIVVETVEKEGQMVQLFTSRGARRFSTVGKDDIAYAMMYAYAAFRVWLQGEEETPLPEEDQVGFCGS